jgi:hypothetical protein
LSIFKRDHLGRRNRLRPLTDTFVLALLRLASQAVQQLQGFLQELAYAQQRDSDGNLTITVQAQPVS